VHSAKARWAGLSRGGMAPGGIADSASNVLSERSPEAGVESKKTKKRKTAFKKLFSCIYDTLNPRFQSCYSIDYEEYSKQLHIAN
jgi:hypothetical protein